MVHVNKHFPGAPGENGHRTWRWGILGTGAVASSFARGLAWTRRAQLIAVGSRSSQKAKHFARCFGVPNPHGSYEQLVASPAVDVVYIATPHYRHHEDCLLALEAGKAVLCEKPFATGAERARQVVDFARRKQLFCMEAMWMRFLPLIHKLDSLLAAGAIGELRSLTADFSLPTKHDPANRFFDPALGGGALLDRGVYPLSLAFHLFGTPTDIVSCATQTETGVDEQQTAVLRYPGGELATLTSSLSSFGPNEAVLAGTHGRIRIRGPICRPEVMTIESAPWVSDSAGVEGDSWRGRLRNYAAENRLVRFLRHYFALPTAWTNTRIPYRGNGYNHEAEEVIRCLDAGKLESEIMPLDETVRIAETTDLIQHQWQTGVGPASCRKTPLSTATCRSGSL